MILIFFVKKTLEKFIRNSQHKPRTLHVSRAGQIFEIFKCFKCFKNNLKNVSGNGNFCSIEIFKICLKYLLNYLKYLKYLK